MDNTEIFLLSQKIEEFQKPSNKNILTNQLEEHATNLHHFHTFVFSTCHRAG